MILAWWIKKAIPSNEILSSLGFNPQYFILIVREPTGLKSIVSQNNYDTLAEVIEVVVELVFHCYYNGKYVKCSILDANLHILFQYGFEAEFEKPLYLFEETITQAYVEKNKEKEREALRCEERNYHNDMLKGVGYWIPTNEEV